MSGIDILVPLCSTSIGGAENHTASLVRWLAAQDHRPTVCIDTSEAMEPLVRELRDAGIAVERGPFGLNESLGFREAMAIQRGAFAKVAAGRDALVLLPSPWPTKSCALLQAARERSMRVVCIHHLISSRHSPNEVVQQIFSDAAEDGVRMVAVSDQLADTLAMTMGIDRRLITVINNGVQQPPAYAGLGPELRQALRAEVRGELGLPPEELLLVTSGRINKQKGYDVLAAAVVEVVRCRPDCHFLWLGDGEDRDAFDQLLRELRVSTYVSRLGRVDDVYRYLVAGDVFVLPSRFEGLSLAMLEAASMAIPAVATLSATDERLFANFQDVVLVPPDQPHLLAGAIDHLVGRPDIRAAMAEKLRQKADQYSAARMLDGYLRLVDEAVEPVAAKAAPPAHRWSADVVTVVEGSALLARVGALSTLPLEAMRLWHILASQRTSKGRLRAGLRGRASLLRKPPLFTNGTLKGGPSASPAKCLIVTWNCLPDEAIGAVLQAGFRRHREADLLVLHPSLPCGSSSSLAVADLVDLGQSVEGLPLVLAWRRPPAWLGDRLAKVLWQVPAALLLAAAAGARRAYLIGHATVEPAPSLDRTALFEPAVRRALYEAVMISHGSEAGEAVILRLWQALLSGWPAGAASLLASLDELVEGDPASVVALHAACAVALSQAHPIRGDDLVQWHEIADRFGATALAGSLALRFAQQEAFHNGVAQTQLLIRRKETSLGRRFIGERQAKRALMYFRRLPYPIRNGSDARVVSNLRLLRELGYETTLSFPLRRDEQSRMTPLASAFAVETGAAVDIAWDGGGDGSAPPSPDHPWQQFFSARYFSHLLRQLDWLQPDAMVVNYAQHGHLAAAAVDGGIRTVLDTHDSVSVRETVLARLQQRFGPDPLATDDPALFDPKSYLYEGGVDFERERLHGNGFDSILAISERDADLFSSLLDLPQVTYLPIILDPQPSSGRRGTQPIYIASENWLNRLGAAFLVKRVLPRLRTTCPGFAIRFVGSICRALPDGEGIIKIPAADDLAACYAESSFALAPIFWATGQNVKIVEAMAYGLPVVAFNTIAGRCHFAEDESLFSAGDADEFCTQVEKLHRDPALCRRGGAAAHRAVMEHHAERIGLERWQQALHGCFA